MSNHSSTGGRNNTHPDAVHEQPDEVEHDPGRAGHEGDREAGEEDGQGDEDARAPQARAQAVLGDPLAAAPLPPHDDRAVGQAPR